MTEFSCTLQLTPHITAGLKQKEKVLLVISTFRDTTQMRAANSFDRAIPTEASELGLREYHLASLEAVLCPEISLR